MGFLFTMFPHQELCARGPSSKNRVQILIMWEWWVSYLLCSLIRTVCEDPPWRTGYKFCEGVLLHPAAATAVSALPPPALVLAQAATAAVFALAPLLLVLTEAATTAVFALAPLLLVFAEAAAATVFTPAPHSLVLAQAATTTVFAQAPHALVLVITKWNLTSQLERWPIKTHAQAVLHLCFWHKWSLTSQLQRRIP